jgi:DNA-binding transcriptional LysR family regulator
MPLATVSARVARLERALGQTLIQRSTRRMRVTEAGRAYYARCAEALRAIETAEGELAAATSQPSGVLRITASSDGAQLVLPDLVARYLARHPQAIVEILVTNAKVDLLGEGVDLALRAGPLRDSTLQSRRLARAEFALFAAPSYLRARGTPRSPDDLANHEVMVHSRFPLDRLTMVAPGGRFTLRANARARADDMQTLRALAEAGAGIALLPDAPGLSEGGRRIGSTGAKGMNSKGAGGKGMDGKSTGRERAAAARSHEEAARGRPAKVGALARVLPEYRMRGGEIFFVYPAGQFVSPSVRAFIDLAVEGMKVAGE